MAAGLEPKNLPAFVSRRFREASDNARGGKHVLRSQTDPIIFQLHGIQIARQGVGKGHDNQALARFDRDVVRALEIHESQPGLLRAQLQAYLLTDLSFDEIGKRLNESTNVVELYSLSFFDVRQGLQNQPQSAQEVVAAYQEVSPNRLVWDFLWKLVAVISGVQALEAIVAPAEVRTMGDVAATSAAEAKSIAKFRVAEAAKAIRITDPNSVSELRRLLESLSDVQPNDENAQIFEHIDATMKAIKFMVGTPEPETTPPELMPYSMSACELSAVELQREAWGRELPNKKEILAMRFPEGPADLAVLSIPERQPESDAVQSAEVKTDHADSPSEPMPENLPIDPKTQRGLAEVQSKRNRINRKEAKVANRPAAQDEAPQQDAQKDAKVSETEERMRQLDLEWSAFAGNSTGGELMRKRAAFRKRYPHYRVPEARLNFPMRKR